MSETDQWLYKIGEADLGPVSEADLINLYRDGHISDETHIRLQGQETGKQIAEAFPQIGETPPTSSEEDTWCDTSPHPWRRFFARTIDLNVNAFGSDSLLFENTSVQLGFSQWRLAFWAISLSWHMAERRWANGSSAFVLSKRTVDPWV